MKQSLSIVKIGGNILDDPEAKNSFLSQITLRVCKQRITDFLYIKLSIEMLGT